MYGTELSWAPGAPAHALATTHGYLTHRYAYITYIHALAELIIHLTHARSMGKMYICLHSQAMYTKLSALCLSSNVIAHHHCHACQDPLVDRICAPQSGYKGERPTTLSGNIDWALKD